MKFKKGDIFEFAINENNKSYGQIINLFKKDAITIVIFEGQYKSRPDLEELLEDNILFFGNTFDAKLYHKYWVIVANETSNIDNIKLPYYKIDVDPVYIEDFYEKRIRQATAYEEEQLYYKAYIAPVRFETALKAYYKQIEWNNECFDKILYSSLLRSVEIVEGGGSEEKQSKKKRWFF